LKIFESLSVASWAGRSAFSLSLRGNIWLPFLIAAACQTVALLFLVSFHTGLALPVALPLVRLLGGEAATHYPIFYYALPPMFHKLTIVITILVASFTGAVATLQFAKAYGFEIRGGVWGRALRCWPTLAVVSFVATLVVMGISLLGTLVPKEAVLNDPIVRWGVRFGELGLFIIVQALVAYTTAWVALMGHRLLPAFRDSARVTVRTFIPTILVVGIPSLLLFPFSYVFGRMDLIANKLRPEVVPAVLGLELLVTVLVVFFMVGAVTRLFIWRVQSSDA